MKQSRYISYIIEPYETEPPLKHLPPEAFYTLSQYTPVSLAAYRHEIVAYSYEIEKMLKKNLAAREDEEEW